MIRAIIIDDEKDARFILKNMLDRNFSKKIEVVAEADDVDPGVAAIEKHKPDVVFLDIQMHKGTGFDLLDKVKKVDFEIVFTTAFNQYAVEAFKFSAFGYLLKPIKTKDLNSVVKQLESHLIRQKEGANKRLNVLVENYGDEGKTRKLIITNMEGFKVVEVEHIIRLEGDRNYTNFIIENNRKVTTSKNLGEYEEMLNEYGFFRIHQSTIINLRHVKAYAKGDGGLVEMSDGANLKLSRHRKAEFMRRFI